jgi:hypothetical protein
MLVRLRRFKTSRGEDGTDVRPDQRWHARSPRANVMQARGNSKPASSVIYLLQHRAATSELLCPHHTPRLRRSSSSPPWIWATGPRKARGPTQSKSRAGRVGGNKRGEHTQTKKPLRFSLLHHPSFLSLPLVSHPGSATPMS